MPERTGAYFVVVWFDIGYMIGTPPLRESVFVLFCAYFTPVLWTWTNDIGTLVFVFPPTKDPST